MSSPRVVVVGCGGLGSYFGLQCARAGFDVTLVARGAHGAAIRARGLELVLGAERTQVPVQCVATTAEAGTADLVLFCVKCYDLETAAATLSPLLTPQSVLLSVQNGVENLERLAGVVSADRLLGAVVFQGGANLTAPGVVEKGSLTTHLIVGGREARGVARAQWTCELLRKAEIDSSASVDPAAFREAQWLKLCRIAGLSGVSCVVRASAGAIVGSPKARALLVEAVEEALRIADAAGVSLTGQRVVQETLDICQRVPDMKTSMLRDLERGKPIEIDAFSGAILRAAARSGLDAPVHRYMCAALSLVERGSAGVTVDR